MLYLFIATILTVLLIVYFNIAAHFNIVDKPNQRSSHTEITLRGGGIIFWFAALAYFTLHTRESLPFFIGITLVSGISFYDDIKNLSVKIRVLVQVIALSTICYSLNIFHLLPWWSIPIIYILSVGVINAYNFMDGINGITGLYTLVVFFSFYLVNTQLFTFIDSDFLILPMLASVIFLFFNFRDKAKCFSGDIGSISLAFWIIYVIMSLSTQTHSIIWILFLAVYGLDSICTIIHRLYLKQNIFEAHRFHFYQFLSNECKIDHRIVALSYAFLQILISFIVIILYNYIETYYIFAIIIIPLLIVYITARYIVFHKYIQEN